MQSFSRHLNVLVASLVIFAVGCFATTANGEEPYERFLEELRLNGFHDTAVDYLDSLAKSDLCSEEFKKRIPMEKALVMIEAAKGLKDLKRHEQYLDRAETWLADFVASKPAADLMAQSEKLRAQLYFGRGLVYLRLADSDRKTEDQKNELRKKARTLLTQAWDTLSKNRAFAQSQIENMVIDPAREKEQKKIRQKLQNEYIQIKLIMASTAESLADTFPSGTAEQKKQLQTALKEHQTNWEKYRANPMGLNAAVGVARCHKRLGNEDLAVAACLEIFEQDDIAAFRTLKKQAAMICSEIWQAKQPLPHADIIARIEPIIVSLDSVEQRQADWLELQLLLAKAYRAKAEKYEKGDDKKDNKTRGIITSNNKSAVRMARRVARMPGPTRKIARDLLTAWKVTLGKLPDDGPVGEITTFEQARLKSRDMMADVEDFRNQLVEIKGKVAAAGENVPAELQSEFDNALQALTEKTDEVQAVLATAMDLSNENTSSDELASVRYLQCYCYFAVEKHFETIVIGQYLLERFPNANATRDACGLVVKSYLQLYLTAKKNNVDFAFELANLKNIAGVMISRWPGQSATETAAVIMSRLATQNKDFAAAEKYVQAIPESSPNRINEELRIGQIYWFDYVNKTRKADATTMKKFLPLRDKAKSLLEKNVAQLSVDGLAPENARAALSLTDLYLDEGLPAKAIDQLENATVAPLDLIKQKHAAAQSPKFVSDTYKTSVRAYIAAMGKDGNAAKWVQKAQGVLSGLAAALKKADPKTAEAKLRSVYIQLAKESKSQMDKIESSKDRVEFANSLLTFLENIQNTSKDVQTLLWVGQTLNGIGMSLASDGNSTAARRIHETAIKSFEKAKGIGLKGNPNKAKIELEIERQIAVALRGRNQFEKAVKKLADILEKKAYLDIQMDAALTYQMWADKESGKADKANYYARALMGGEKRPRPNKRPANVIWGWRNLVRATLNKPKLEPQFYECLYNMCYTQMKYGQVKQNKKALTSAINEMSKFAKRSESMGGLRDKFNQLAIDIQKSLGESAKGIPAYEGKSKTGEPSK